MSKKDKKKDNMSKKDKKKTRIKYNAAYVIGSIVLTAASAFVFPKYVGAASSYLYKKQPRNAARQRKNYRILSKRVRKNK